MRKLDKKTAFGSGIVVGAGAQLSRNRNIRNVGGLVLYATIMGAIGQILGFLIKWFIWKPIVLCCKLFWVSTVFICKTSWRLAVISFMALKKVAIELYKYLKIKHMGKKAVE